MTSRAGGGARGGVTSQAGRGRGRVTSWEGKMDGCGDGGWAARGGAGGRGLTEGPPMPGRGGGFRRSPSPAAAQDTSEERRDRRRGEAARRTPSPPTPITPPPTLLPDAGCTSLTPPELGTLAASATVMPLSNKHLTPITVFRCSFRLSLANIYPKTFLAPAFLFLPTLPSPSVCCPLLL